MSRIIKRKRIYMCMASVMCMLLLLIPLPVSANDLGSILLKATVEDETTVYKLSNTEFTMYQVGTYKNNSWALVSEFVKSGVIFDFDDSSAQAEAAKKLEKYVQDNNIKGMPGKPIQTEKSCTEIWKKECIFLSRHKKHKLAIKYIKANLLS